MDNLEIIVKTLIDINKDDSVKQVKANIPQIEKELNANNVRINIVAGLDLTKSKALIQTSLDNIIKTLNIPPINISFGSATSNNIAANLQGITNSANNANNSIKLANKSLLEFNAASANFKLPVFKDNNDDIIAVKTLQKAREELSKIAEVKEIGWIRDSSGELTGIKAKLQDINNLVESFRFTYDGDFLQFSGSSGTDSQIQKTIELLDKAKAKAEKTFATFNNKTQSSFVNTTLYKEVEGLLKSMSNLDDIEKFNNKMAELEAYYQKITAYTRSGNKSINPFINAINDSKLLDEQLTRIQVNYDKLTAKSTSLDKSMAELKTLATNIKQYQVGTEEWAKAYGVLKAKITEVNEQIKTTNSVNTKNNVTQKLIQDLDILENRIKIFRNNNSKAEPKFGSAFDELLRKINNLKANTKDLNTASLSHIRKEFEKLNKEISATGYNGVTILEDFKDKIKKFSSWFSISQVITGTINKIHEMIDVVKELDASLTELRKVTDLTGQELKEFTREAYDLGATIGRTGKEVIDATTTFVKAGYDIEESLNSLAKAALIMTNVGDGITDTAEAASVLISVLKGFKMDSSQALSIVDIINEVSNTSAIDFDNITEGLRRISSTYYQTGTSIEETVGLITGAFSQLRDIETTSSGKSKDLYVQKCA